MKSGVAGFEPTNDGVKVRSLTAWRYPKHIEFSNHLYYNNSSNILYDLINILLK